MLARLSSEYPISNAIWQLVWPFINGLVRNSHCLRSCGDRSAEKFNSFCFIHLHIEPQLN